MGSIISIFRTSKRATHSIFSTWINSKNDSPWFSALEVQPSETLLYLWLDKNFYKNLQVIAAAELLKQNVKNVFVVDDRYKFDQWQTKRHANESIVLIVSNEWGKQLVPDIHSSKSIAAIYVHCMDDKTDTKWTESYSKVRGVISDPNKLVQLVSTNMDEFKHIQEFNSEPVLPGLSIPYAASSCVEDILEKKDESRGGDPTNFQFVLIDLSTRLNELASAMLKCLYALAEGSIIIFDNTSLVDFNELSNKVTLLFVSSEFATTMKSKPEQTKVIFMLEDDINKVDHRERFATGEDLIFQLADELYRCYKKEANDCLTFSDTSMAEIKEKQASRIYSEVKTVHQNYCAGKNMTRVLICTTTILVWLKSKSENDMEVEKMQDLFRRVVSAFPVFDSQADCQSYLLENKTAATVFLIISTDYEDSIVVDLQQIPNVKFFYRSGQASMKNYDNLCFQLTYDLIGHYKKLGTDCRAIQDAKTAKDMFMKAHELCNILAEL